MGKYIGIKMIEATPMKASMALEHDYKIGNHNTDDLGYEISYPDGYKSWCPAEEFDKYYYHIQDENGDMLYRNDIEDFIASLNVSDNVKEELGKISPRSYVGI